MLKISDVRTRSGTGTYAVIDVSRSIGKGDPGAVVSTHKGRDVATRAAKKIKNSRVVQLRVALKVGDHPNALSDLVPERILAGFSRV